MEIHDVPTVGPGHATELAREAVSRQADLVLVLVAMAR
jgi:diacylglycerol kinase family enzyme